MSNCWIDGAASPMVIVRVTASPRVWPNTSVRPAGRVTVYSVRAAVTPVIRTVPHCWVTRRPAGAGDTRTPDRSLLPASSLVKTTVMPSPGRHGLPESQPTSRTRSGG